MNDQERRLKKRDKMRLKDDSKLRSRNVFRDLGFEDAEAENLKIRAYLIIVINEFVNSSEMTQEEAARLFGVTQPRVSDLARGKIEKFTIDMLVNMLANVGHKVTVSVEPPDRKAA